MYHLQLNRLYNKLWDKVKNRIRITAEEGLLLLNATSSDEREEIRQLADHARKDAAGDLVHFASTLCLYPTNLCELSCPMCSFYAKPGWEKAWFFTPEQLEERVRQNSHLRLTEIHIVSGLWRDCDLYYYKDLFTRIKSFDANLHIKALTPVEYDFLAKKHGISVTDVFKQMISWGLGSLPGGGAEILVESVRKKIAPGKISSSDYIKIHETAHKLGLRSNVTMLFGHIESKEDLITHMIKVRELQDRTGGISTFIPLKFGEKNNALGKRKEFLKEKDLFLVYATARLMLDNVKNLKVLWNYVGVDEALELLRWGGNDLSSTNTDEKVITMAGGKKIDMNIETLSNLIRNVGRTPNLTHSGNF